MGCFWGLDYFFQKHDPTTDQKIQYRSVIFVSDKNQREIVARKLSEYKKEHKDTTTQIEKFEKFYRAEEYHQKYFQKNNVSGVC